VLIEIIRFLVSLIWLSYSSQSHTLIGQHSLASLFWEQALILTDDFSATASRVFLTLTHIWLIGLFREPLFKMASGRRWEIWYVLPFLLEKINN
jgi:hypothetical protein